MSKQSLPPYRADNERLRAQIGWEEIFQAIGNPTVILDPEFRVIAANRAVVQAVGKPEVELLGRKCYELFHGRTADGPPPGCPMQQMLSSGCLETAEMEIDVFGRLYLVSCSPVFDEGGRLHKVIHIVTDITERKRMEKALREREKRFADIADNALEWIWEVDADGQYTYASPVVTKILGYEPKEILGKHFYDLFRPEDQQRLKEEASEVFAQRQPFREFINRNVHKNGTTVWLSTSGVPVFDEEGNLAGYRGADTDITERKRTEEQLFQAQKLESIGRLAGGIAHDFGNLLSVIMGSVSMLQRRRSLPTKVQELLEDISNASERGSTLIKQLLYYARGTSREPVPTDLDDIVRRVLQIVSRTTPPQIRLVPTLREGLSAILADSTQIEQVVMNLCLNAVEASQPPSSIDITTEEQVLDSNAAAPLELSEGRYVRLSIKDQGCGMDEETMGRMFEPFFTTKPMGRGMGLSATQGIVQSHHGQIRVDSKPGEGTTVSVWLPVSRERTSILPGE